MKSNTYVQEVSNLSGIHISQQITHVRYIAVRLKSVYHKHRVVLFMDALHNSTQGRVVRVGMGCKARFAVNSRRY